MTKNEWRDIGKSRRQALSAAERDWQSQALVRMICADPRMIRAETVLLFLSFASEWNTDALIRAAWAEGKTACLTRTLPDHAMEACRFTPQTPLVTTRGALQEIPADAAEPIALAQIDFCLVPGLLFDPYGTRLGYGAGYYDRFLPKLSESCTILAAGFDCQLVGSPLPHDATDYRLPEIWTPSQQIRTRKPF